MQQPPAPGQQPPQAQQQQQAEVAGAVTAGIAGDAEAEKAASGRPEYQSGAAEAAATALDMLKTGCWEGLCRGGNSPRSAFIGKNKK